MPGAGTAWPSLLVTVTPVFSWFRRSSCTRTPNAPSLESPKVIGPSVAVRVRSNASSTPAGLAKLRPAFRPDGTVTAGNVSQLSDGAAAVVVASSDAAGRLGARPLARVVSYATSGVHPKDIFIAPVSAVPLPPTAVLALLGAGAFGGRWLQRRLTVRG